MEKAVKKSFDIIIKNSAVMQPLILFLFFILLFNSFMSTGVLRNAAIGLIFLVLSILLLSAFLSGWFYTIKYAVDTYQKFDKNDPDYSLKIGLYNIETFKKFFSGVGEYFFPVLLVIIIAIVFNDIVAFAGQKLLNINNLQFLTQEISTDIQSVQALPKISLNQILFVFYLFLCAFVIRFLTLFWIPALFYKTKNPFTSLFKSIKFLFKNFLVSIGIYLFLFSLYAIFFVFIGISVFSIILQLICFVILLYLITFSIVFIFTIYRQILVQKEVEKVNANDIFIKSSEIFEVENKEDEQK